MTTGFGGWISHAFSALEYFIPIKVGFFLFDYRFLFFICLN